MYSLRMASTTEAVNLEGSTCHAPQEDLSVMFGDLRGGVEVMVLLALFRVVARCDVPQGRVAVICRMIDGRKRVLLISIR